MSQLSQDSDQSIPEDNICQICENWGDDTSDIKACDECPNSYHMKCVSKERNLDNFGTCCDLERECMTDWSKAIVFKFGDKIKEDLIKKSQRRKEEKQKEDEKQDKDPKQIKKDKKGRKGRKRRRSIYGSQKFKRTWYRNCLYKHSQYKIGDDIAIDCDNGSIEYCRITHIYKDDDIENAKVSIIWYWKAKHVLGDDNLDYPADNELFLDEATADTQNWATVQHKIYIFGSKEEFIKKGDAETSFWCTHGYTDHNKKKFLLASHIIPGAIIKNTTPAPNKKSKKRTRIEIIENDLESANKLLMLSSIPAILPCREKEHKEIQTFMKNAIIKEGIGSGLYISGMPGTGKTATVRQIARELQQLTITSNRGKYRNKKKPKLPPFNFYEINAMKLPTPRHLYTELCKYLLNKHHAPSTAVKKLEKYFNTRDRDRKICVLLVDELDYLLTRKQKVIYNIFDWPTRLHSKLVIIGIANTMDLPERLLPRVSSRLGVSRIVFKPYSKAQLIKIVQSRLEETKVFNDDAIKYCASSVASITGDCRAVLQICRRAIDVASKEIKDNKLLVNNNNNNKRIRKRNKNKNKNKNNQIKDFQVSLLHIKKAKNAFDQSNDVQVVQTCAIYEKLFLTAMVMYNSYNNGIAGTLDQYRRKFNTFAQTSLGNAMDSVHFRNMLNRLENIGLITMTFVKKDWVEWIKLNVDIEDVKLTLQEDDICGKILSSLQT